MPFLFAAAPTAAAATTTTAAASTAAATTATSAAAAQAAATAAAAAAAKTAAIQTALMYTAVAATGVGTVMGVMSAQEAAKNQAALMKYGVATKEQEAEARRRAGKAQTEEMRDRKRRLLSSMEVGRAKRGILSSGSPLLVELETAELAELDALTAGYNVEIGARQAESEATEYRMRAKSAVREGKLAAGTALFSGGAQMATLGYMGTKKA